ncbi:dolichyl-diphosphooligosaccharide--protein glycosyltransferase subunit 1 [Vanrija albida]|uniref:Dolichyl-diphosphooligosaccharide--protein glycosyltransferase subunit 1 n=1 Tax=Vanrija albida TaxID=181172 RepID=A0ABR3Q2E9_9TREE
MRITPLLGLAAALATASARRSHLDSDDATPQSFVNTAVARTVELGGATSLVTTQYNAKALVDNPGAYVLALGGQGAPPPAWYEVLVGGKAVDGVEFGSLDGAPALSVPVGKLAKDAAVVISLTALTAHSSRPLPHEIGQRDPQYLLWETNSTLVDSAYKSDVERIKIRAPTPSILQHGNVPTTYTRDTDVTKSGSTLTLGPFYGVPPTIGGAGAADQAPFYVHYETTNPIVGIRSLKRAAEVSHWGGNLNIQDEIALFNDGPTLRGQFSRLAHQQSKFHATKPAQILTELTLRLPPTAHSVYYYDVIGNVSTSHFRPGQGASTASLTGRAPRVVDGTLEIKPRYPVLGGWNYSFTVGWDSPLSGALRVDAKTGRHVLAVPFLTGLKDVVVDDEELRIVLPDGATDVEVFTPFPVDAIEHSVHKTYLDTTGRPVVTITKALVTENHAQNVYVSYNYPLSAQLQKPLIVTGVVGVLLFVFIVLRRVDYNIASAAERKRK